MSLIRRLNRVQALEHEINAARKEGRNLTPLLERLKKIAPRGAEEDALRPNNAVNVQHFEAHKYLQAAQIGTKVKTTWLGKDGNWYHATYVRRGYRANISRKWLSAEARL